MNAESSNLPSRGQIQSIPNRQYGPNCIGTVDYCLDDFRCAEQAFDKMEEEHLDKHRGEVVFFNRNGLVGLGRTRKEARQSVSSSEKPPFYVRTIGEPLKQVFIQ